MHASVLAKWHEFSEPLEGRVHSMYVDVKNLVTTGVGNLIDPVGQALRLPWKHPDGSRATDVEIRQQWLALKHHPGLQVKPGGPLVPLSKLHWRTAAKLTTLRLTDADIDAIVVGKLLENERALMRAFPGWLEWPADAQLAALSMAWAVGAGFPGIFKNFTRAANAGDWLGARAACKIRTDNNPGVVPRNKHNELCLTNAAIVAKHGLPRSTLHWPSTAAIPAAAENVDPSILTEMREADELRRAAIQAQAVRFDDIGILRANAMRELSGLESTRPTEIDHTDGGGDGP